MDRALRCRNSYRVPVKYPCGAHQVRDAEELDACCRYPWSTSWEPVYSDADRIRGRDPAIDDTDAEKLRRGIPPPARKPACCGPSPLEHVGVVRRKMVYLPYSPPVAGSQDQCRDHVDLEASNRHAAYRTHRTAQPGPNLRRRTPGACEGCGSPAHPRRVVVRGGRCGRTDRQSRIHEQVAASAER